MDTAIIGGFMRNSAILTGAVLGLWAMLGASQQAAAGIIYSTGFESPDYTTGALAGQNGWSGSVGTVQTSTVYAGTQAVEFDATGLSGQHTTAISLPSAGQGSVMRVNDEFYFSANDANVVWTPLALIGNNGFLGQLVITNGNVALGLASTTTGSVAVTSGAWHSFTMEFDFLSGMQSAFVDSTLIGTGAMANPATSLTAFLMGINNTNGPARTQAYVDNLSFSTVSSTVPEPPELALMGIGLIGLAAARRRANASRNS